MTSRPALTDSVVTVKTKPRDALAAGRARRTAARPRSAGGEHRPAGQARCARSLPHQLGRERGHAHTAPCSICARGVDLDGARDPSSTVRFSPRRLAHFPPLDHTDVARAADLGDYMAYFVTGRDRVHRTVPARRTARARGHDLRAVPGQLARQARRSARAPRRRRRPHRPGRRRPVEGPPRASRPTRSSSSTARSSTSSTSPPSTTSPPTPTASGVANVEGTRHALQLAEAVHAEHFHQVSSIAAAGLYKGTFTEDMFDEATDVDNNPYYATKHESERVVREESTIPWRVYRPGIVVGSSETGEIDKIDGPYYFFRAIQRLRGLSPSWLRGIGIEGGPINIVPVDYVAKAMDYLAHQPGLDGRAFHLTDPRADDRRADGQRVRQGGEGAAVRVQRRHQADRVGGPRDPQAAAGCRRRGCRAPSRRPTSCSPSSASRARCCTTSTTRRTSTRRRRRKRWPVRSIEVPPLVVLRADALGVLGAHVQPGPPQGPLARPRDQGQDRDDHRRVVGHRPGDRTAGRRGRRQGHPRRARRREARADQDRDRGRSAASRSCTAATSPT